MKQIILWLIFVSLAVADVNVTKQNMEKYGLRTLYHITTKEYDLALSYAKMSCSLGSSESCLDAAYIYLHGNLEGKVEVLAKEYLEKACSLKHEPSCELIKKL